VSPPSPWRVSPPTFFYLSDLVYPLFFVNSATKIFFVRVSPPGGCHPGPPPLPGPLVTPLLTSERERMHVCGWSWYAERFTRCSLRVVQHSRDCATKLTSEIRFTSRPASSSIVCDCDYNQAVVRTLQRRLLLAYRARVTHLGAGRARCPTTNAICCDCSWQVLMTSVNALWTYETAPLEFRRFLKTHLFSSAPWRPIVTCLFGEHCKWKIRKTLGQLFEI